MADFSFLILSSATRTIPWIPNPSRPASRSPCRLAYASAFFRTMSATALQSSNFTGHSADVRINLILNGHSIPVAQLGPGFLLLDRPKDHPPGPASIVLRVDQSEERWDVHLPQGISADCKRVAIRAAV